MRRALPLPVVSVVSVVVGVLVSAGCALPRTRSDAPVPARIPVPTALSPVPRGVAFVVDATADATAGADWEAAVFVDDIAVGGVDARKPHGSVEVPFGNHALRVTATRFEPRTTTTMQAVAVPVQVTVPCGTGTCTQTQTQTQMRPVSTTVRTAVATCESRVDVAAHYEEPRALALTISLPGCAVVDVAPSR